MNDLVQQTEALLRFSADVENRMTDSGMGGVNGVIERYMELRRALERVSDQELGWAKGEVQRLVETLSCVAEQIDHLYAIKTAIAQNH